MGKRPPRRSCRTKTVAVECDLNETIVLTIERHEKVGASKYSNLLPTATPAATKYRVTVMSS